MDILKQKWKKNLILKTWERFKSLGFGSGHSDNSSCVVMKKSKSWYCTTKSSSSPERNKKMCQVAPEGCFSVYVGPKKQRFVIRTESGNHPLFKTLFEDAESEYGYENQGPIMLPCDVKLFYKVLAEMESGDEIDPGCSFAKGYFSPLILSSPARRPNQRGNGGAYRLFRPSRMLKMNGF